MGRLMAEGLLLELEEGRGGAATLGRGGRRDNVVVVMRDMMVMVVLL